MSEGARAAGPLDWTVHPFRQRPVMGGAVLFAIVAISVGASLWGGSAMWGIFSFLILFLSLESFYFPTRYVLEDAKVTVVRRFSKSEREWQVFRRGMEDRDGITLSPFRKTSFLEAYRSIRLRFGPDNREAVSGFVRDRLREDADYHREEDRRAS